MHLGQTGAVPLSSSATAPATQLLRPVPVAAGSGLRALLSGPPQPVTVAGIGRGAAHLRTGDGRVVTVMTADAPRLPCAVVTGSRAPLDLPWTVGQSGTAGAGRLLVGDLTLPVRRWWSARPVLEPPAPGRLAAAGALLRRLPDDAAEVPQDVIDGLAHAVAGQDPIRAAVRALAGLGPGLTPAGDDVLVGLLSALVCLRHPQADRYAEEVLAGAAGRTTDLSTTLLRHAAAGECLAAVAGLLQAVCRTGDPSGARRALAAVGHSSGPALCLGVRLGVQATAGEIGG